MSIEKSAGAVVFKKEDDKIYYLLLRYQGTSHRTDKDYWDLPKGHIEKGETLEETVKREVKEETGLKDVKIVPGFKETIKYFFKWEDKNILKFVTFFTAEAETDKVEISDEHIGFEWLSYDQALSKVTFKNAKEILKKANDFIIKKEI
jgi:8-oxo-dGTP pyrophosphatase MutT (NUDIX family)